MDACPDDLVAQYLVPLVHVACSCINTTWYRRLTRRRRRRRDARALAFWCRAMPQVFHIAVNCIVPDEKTRWAAYLRYRRQVSLQPHRATLLVKQHHPALAVYRVVYDMTFPQTWHTLRKKARMHAELVVQSEKRRGRAHTQPWPPCRPRDT